MVSPYTKYQGRGTTWANDSWSPPEPDEQDRVGSDRSTAVGSDSWSRNLDTAKASSKPGLRDPAEMLGGAYDGRSQQASADRYSAQALQRGIIPNMLGGERLSGPGVAGWTGGDYGGMDGGMGPGGMAPAFNPFDTERMRLEEVFAAARAGSGKAYDRIATNAASRNDAIVEALGGMSDQLVNRLQGVPGEVTDARPSGTLLSSNAVNAGAQDGVASLTSLAATLGGFNQQAQTQRGAATQNYLDSMKAQTEFGLTTAEAEQNAQLSYLEAEQQALMQQEMMRQQQDIAANTANDPLTRALFEQAGVGQLWQPGMSMDDANSFIDNYRSGYGTWQAPDEAAAAAEEDGPRGLLEVDFMDAGLSAPAANAMARVEVLANNGKLQFQRALGEGEDSSIYAVPEPGTPQYEQIVQQFGDITNDDEAWDAFRRARFEEWMDQNVIQVEDDDPRAGTFVTRDEAPGGKRVSNFGAGYANTNAAGQKLYIGKGDWSRYQQWLASL